MRVAQFQFIQQQHQKYVQSQTQSNDRHVKNAVRDMIDEAITPYLTVAQRQMFFDLTERDATKTWFAQLKEQHVEAIVIPTERELQQLFKKEKKLKLPKQLLQPYVVFFSWDDPTQMKRFIVHEKKGIVGVLSKQVVKGICTICHRHNDTVLFTVKTKSSGDGMYTKNSQYICVDSYQCNQLVVDEQRVQDFIATLQAI